MEHTLHVIYGFWILFFFCFFFFYSNVEKDWHINYKDLDFSFESDQSFPRFDQLLLAFISQTSVCKPSIYG